MTRTIRHSCANTCHSRACGNPVCLAFLFAVVVLLSHPASGQVATGFPPFGSFGGGPFDIVNNANRNVHFEIPIINKAGRGMPFNYAVTYDSSIWLPVNSTGQYAWTPVGGTSSNPNGTWGWQGTSQSIVGYVTFYTLVQYCNDHNGQQYPYDVLSSWSYYDAQGTAHAFPGLSVSNLSLTPCTNNQNPPYYSGSATANDGSGWQISVTAGPYGMPAQPTATEHSVSGVAFVAPFFSGGSSASNTLTDPNGNVIKYSGGTLYDTLSSTVPVLTIGGDWQLHTTTYTWTPDGSSTGTVTFIYTQKTVQTNFGCPGQSEFGPTPSYLVTEIDLPDNTKYLLGYEATPGYPANVTGRIAYITLPTGGTISYAYSGGYNGISCYVGSTPTLTRTTPDGVWTYGPGYITAPADPQGNHAYTSLSFQGVYETERDIYQYPGSTLLETVNTCYNSSATSCNGTAVTLPITQRTVTTTLGNLKSQTQTFYDSNGMVTKVDEYGFGNGAVGPFKRETMTCYASLSMIHDHPSARVVYSATGSPSDCSGTSNLAAKTTYTYFSNGNLDTETRYTGGTPASISRNFTYGAHGVLLTSSDFKAHQTTYANTACDNSFPTTITLPKTSLAYTLEWNCDGGVVTSNRDPNQQPTTYHYDDPHFWLLTSITYPDGGSVSTPYTSPTVWHTYTAIDDSRQRHDQLDLDGLGRVSTKSLVNDPDGQTYVTTSYDPVGRPLTVTNPHRTSSTGSDTYSYDALNRVTQVTHADSSSSQISYGGIATQNCSPSTYGYGYPTVYTDESGHQRRTFTNALGSIIEVDEPDAAGHLTVQTCSTYDLLGNLTAVSHTSQSRSYGRDKLGRVTSATTPEAGTVTYTYAVSGNACSGDPSAPCTRKDARNITTTYTYNDNLNRLTSKTYSDSTPPVTFSYDQTSVTIGSWSSGTLLNPEGRLTKATTTSGGNVQTAVVYSYDPVGRIKDFWQCNPSNCANVYNTHYNYDLAGDVTSWVHPGVFTLTNTVSVAQRVTNVQSSLTGANFPQTLAQNITYTPWGAVSQLQNGCVGDGCTMVQETYDYNNRLQPVRIQLGTATNNSANHCLVYNYYSDVGNPSSCAAPSQGTANNGNVMGYWYQDNVQPWTHTASYTYDNLNRLATAWATGNATYNLTFGYDRYGNMTCVTNGQTNGPCPNLTFSLGTNRLTTSAFTYDAAGNLTNDSSTTPAHTYQWDAEERVKSVDNGSTWSFTYNAVGDRVQWSRPGATDQHIFDAAGTSLGVYGGWDVVWMGGRVLTVYEGSETNFFHVNHLNSASMLTNHAGTAVEDILFYPWGQDTWHLWGSGGYNFAGMPYYDTNTNTNPTNFRFYSQNIGRWHSPDPVAGDITNPQSLNRYAYALNNPTSLTDPLGLDPCNGIATVDCNAEQASQSNHGGGGGGGSCYLDGVSINCGFAFGLIGGGGAVNTTGTDTSPRYGSHGWSFFGCFADDSCGFVPGSLSGFSPRDISNALRAVKTAGAGWIVSARDLAGNAADAYRLLQLLGVDRSAITIFLSGGGLSIVLTPEAFAALMHSQIASHIGDTTLHYPYTNGARDLRPRNSLHLLWFDPRLTNFVGGAGVYMELHADPDNPWTGSFSGHMGCVVFGVCPGI